MAATGAKAAGADTEPNRHHEADMEHSKHQLGEATGPAQHHGLKHSTEPSNRAAISNKQTLMEAAAARKQALLTARSKRQQRPTQRLQLQLLDTIRQGTEHSNLPQVLTVLVRLRTLLLNSSMAPTKHTVCDICVNFIMA